MLAAHRLGCWGITLLLCLSFLTSSCCNYCKKNNAPTLDPRVVVNEKDLQEDSNNLSPPIVKEPLYACTNAIVVQGFIPDAKIEIFVNGTSVGGNVSDSQSGQLFAISATLAVGDSVTATQTFDGKISDAEVESAGFTTFLFGRMIGTAIEVDDHQNRGRNMDTRTAASKVSYVG